jgi:hypothetical protein
MVGAIGPTEADKCPAEGKSLSPREQTNRFSDELKTRAYRREEEWTMCPEVGANLRVHLGCVLIWNGGEPPKVPTGC